MGLFSLVQNMARRTGAIETPPKKRPSSSSSSTQVLTLHNFHRQSSSASSSSGISPNRDPSETLQCNDAGGLLTSAIQSLKTPVWPLFLSYSCSSNCKQQYLSFCFISFCFGFARLAFTFGRVNRGHRITSNQHRVQSQPLTGVTQRLCSITCFGALGGSLSLPVPCPRGSSRSAPGCRFSSPGFRNVVFLFVIVILVGCPITEPATYAIHPETFCGLANRFLPRW